MSMPEIILEDNGYLAARSPQTTLELSDEKAQANFELGVAMVLYKWDDLTTAVVNNWGGAGSADKRDWMTTIVVDAFKQNTDIDIIYIHEMLFNAMEDEFGAVIEDESTVVCAQQIVEIYKQCLNGDYSNVQRMYQRWLEKRPQNVQHVENNSDSSDSEEIPELTDGMDVDVEMDIDRPSREPGVDEDGFTVVRRGRH